MKNRIELLHDFRTAHPYRQLDLRDGSWRYITAGYGRKKLLLLPGAFIGAEMWLHLITALKECYRIIAPEMPSKPLTISEMSAGLTRITDTEQVERAVVIGYSAGGGLAQAFTQMHPERVEHLILSHCTPLSPDTAERMGRLIRVMRLLPMPLIRAIFRKRSSRYPTESEWADFTRRLFTQRIAVLTKAEIMQFIQGGMEIARAFRFESQALRNWKGHVLLLSSKDDTTTYARINELQERYPSAQTHIFEQGGHHTVLLFPEIYNSTLGNLIANLD